MSGTAIKEYESCLVSNQDGTLHKLAFGQLFDRGSVNASRCFLLAAGLWLLRLVRMLLLLRLRRWSGEQRCSTIPSEVVSRLLAALACEVAHLATVQASACKKRACLPGVRSSAFGADIARLLPGGRVALRTLTFGRRILLSSTFLVYEKGRSLGLTARGIFLLIATCNG